MKKYFNTVVSTSTGKPLADASVRVKTSAGNLATLYSDSGGTALANPVTTNSNGFYEFYIDNGTYTLEFLYGGELLQTITDVEIDDGEMDVVTPQQFGAIADGSTDDYAAFAAALAALSNSGGTLTVPAGEYYIGQTLHIRKPVRILGEGIGQNPGLVDGVTYSGPDIYHGTRLIFPQGTKWVHFHTHTDEDDVATVTAMTDAEKYVEFSAVGSVMRDLCLLGAGLASGATPPVYVANSEAIRTNVAIEVSNVWIINPSGDGIIVSASSASTSYPSDYGNANQCDFRKVKIYKAGRHGFVFEGADANICTTYDCDASFCGGTGIWDTSFLGTTHFAPHLQKNNQSTLATHLGVTLIQDYGSIIVEENSAVTSVYSPYIETPTTGEKMKLMSGCTVYPGIGTADRYIDANTTGCVHNTGGIVGGFYGAWNKIHATVDVRFFMGGGPTQKELVAFGFGNTEDSAAANDWKMLYNTATNLWGLEYGNGGTAQMPIQFGVAASNPSGVNALIAPQGLVLGTNGAGPRIYYGAAAPATGTWRQGDVVWNTGVTAGGSPGWVCTTAGTPGTWKAMANVAA